MCIRDSSGGGRPFPGLNKKMALELRRHLRGRGAVHGDAQAWRAVEELEMSPETLLMAYTSRMEAASRLMTSKRGGGGRASSEGRQPHLGRAGRGRPETSSADTPGRGDVKSEEEEEEHGATAEDVEDTFRRRAMAEASGADDDDDEATLNAELAEAEAEARAMAAMMQAADSQSSCRTYTPDAISSKDVVEANVVPPTLSPPLRVRDSTEAEEDGTTEAAAATTAATTASPGSGSAFRAVRSLHIEKIEKMYRGHLETWPARSEAAARLELNTAAAAVDAQEGTATAYTVSSHAALRSREQRAARPKTLVAMEAALEALPEPPPLWAQFNHGTKLWGDERARGVRGYWHPAGELFAAHRGVLRMFVVNFTTYGGVLDRVDRAYGMATGCCAYEVFLSDTRAREAESARALADERFLAMARRARNCVEVCTRNWRRSLLWAYMMKWKEGHVYRRRGRAVVNKMLKRMLDVANRVIRSIDGGD